uniref:Neur_chan_LBD domain-containing protein n=1 Tax=Rhabditophanes sp. KR3021 TaxID=114890 RepID=A0AC35TXB4_9BILA
MALTTSTYIIILFLLLIRIEGKKNNTNIFSKASPDFVSKFSQMKQPPKDYENEIVDVKLGFYIESLGNFRETLMTFDADLYMYSSWKDKSMIHNTSKYILINEKTIRDSLWRPDLYFANARLAHIHDVCVDNFNMFISPNGVVSLSWRVTVTVACNLKLEHFPFDTNNCFIKILSYGYIQKIMNCTWFSSDPIQYNQNINLPEFEITAIKQGYCDGTYKYARSGTSYLQDTFNCLTLNIYLKRSLGYNLVQNYIPLCINVIVSWLGFFIDKLLVVRVTISVTTLVSITALGNGIRFNLPQVSYPKAIDYYFLICTLFVFGALIEFAFVNNYLKRATKFEQLSKVFKRSAERTNVKSLIHPKYYEHAKHEYAKSFKNMKKPEEKIKSPRNISPINLSPANLSPSSLITNPSSLITSPTHLQPSPTNLRPNWKGSGDKFGSSHSLFKSFGYAFSTNERKITVVDACEFINRDLFNRPPNLQPSEFKKSSIQAGLAAIDDEEMNYLKTFMYKEDISQSKALNSKDLSSLFMKMSRSNSKKSLKLDIVSRFLFPLAFGTFNIIYFTYYLMIQARYWENST